MERTGSAIENAGHEENRRRWPVLAPLFAFGAAISYLIVWNATALSDLVFAVLLGLALGFSVTTTMLGAAWLRASLADEKTSEKLYSGTIVLIGLLLMASPFIYVWVMVQGAD